MEGTQPTGCNAVKWPCFRAFCIASGVALCLVVRQHHITPDTIRRRHHEGSGSRALRSSKQLFEGANVELDRNHGEIVPFASLHLMEEMSVAKTPNQVSNIVFIRTHKTVSTTLKDVLYRYGWIHKKIVARFGGEDPGAVINLPKAASKAHKRQVSRSDIIVHHVSRDGAFVDGDFDMMRSYYEEIMQKEVEMRFVTILREARAHYISHYASFTQPYTQTSLEEYLLDDKVSIRDNLLCAEFGIYDSEGLDRFIAEHLPTFTLILDSDMLDEGLVILARLLKWELVDVLYHRRRVVDVNADAATLAAAAAATWTNDSDGDSARAFLAETPFEELAPAAQARLDAAVALDVRLNKAAAAHYAAIKAQHSGLEQDMAQFASLQEDYQQRSVAFADRKATSGVRPPWP